MPTASWCSTDAASSIRGIRRPAWRIKCWKRCFMSGSIRRWKTAKDLFFHIIRCFQRMEYIRKLGRWLYGKHGRPFFL